MAFDSRTVIRTAEVLVHTGKGALSAFWKGAFPVGTISLGRICDICTFRQCGTAQLYTNVAGQLAQQANQQGFLNTGLSGLKVLVARVRSE